jgi:hypothetical protein
MNAEKVGRREEHGVHKPWFIEWSNPAQKLDGGKKTEQKKIWP